jgi:hypothetical protein
MNIHDLLKLYKHGYSKVTDHLTREIRFKRIDKNSALKLVKKYETNKIKNSKLFCDWLGIDYRSLNFLLDSHKNKKFWKNIDIDRWFFRGLNSINLNMNFQLNSSLSVQGNINYLSARPTVQGEDSRFYNPNTSIKKTFMGGRLTALVQWQNMDMGLLRSNEQRISTSATDFYTTTNYIYEVDVVMLNLSFNLNKLKNKLKLPGNGM